MISTDDGRVHLFDPAHVNASPPGLTPELAAEWAGASDIITINAGPAGKPPPKFQGQTSILESHIHLALGIYTKAGHEYDKTLPEAEYSHTASPATTANRRFDKTWSVYLMQQDSAWRGKHQQDLLTLKADNPWSGVFIADSAAATYHQGGKPWNAVKGRAYTEAEWFALVKASLDAWRGAVGYPYDSLNGLHSYTLTSFTPTIGMMEASFKSLSGHLPSQADWLRDAQLAWDAQTLGWTPWIYIKMGVQHTDPLWAAFRKLMLPSAYILDRGSLGYIQTSKEGMDPSWVTLEFQHPWYRPDIGDPGTSRFPLLSSYVDASGAYVKYYSRGVVIVNPQAVGVSVHLPDGTLVPVAPQSGAILRANTVTNWVPVA